MSDVQCLVNYKPRENSGSRSTNRLLIQVSFAFSKILEIYDETDFIIIMDYIDDVALLKIQDNKESLTTFQLKTRDKAQGEYSISSLIKDDVFYKLYDHLEQIYHSVNEIYLITNIPIKHSKITVKEEHIRFIDIDDIIKSKIESNMKKSNAFSTFGFSDKFIFSLVDISINNHHHIIKSNLLDFLRDRSINLDIRSFNAFYTTISDILTKKQSYEFSMKENPSILINKKGFPKKEFDKLLNETISIDSIDLELIKKNYYPDMKLMQEVRLNKALANFKSKSLDFPEATTIGETDIILFINKNIELCDTRLDLLILLREKLSNHLSKELTSLEKDIFFIFKIEEFLQRGLEDD